MLQRLARYLDSMLGSVRPQRRTLLLVAVWALLFGSLIALDVLVLRQVIDAELGPVMDISYYRFRTQGMLDGQWLYRDIPCESPPLAVLAMLPAQLANGGCLAYQVWFSLFVLLTSLTMYWGLRRFDDRRAFMAALFLLFIPVGTVETVYGIQDEAIVVWVFVLSIVLAAAGRLRPSALAMAAGAWTKIINVLLYPFLWRAAKGGRERAIHLGIIAMFSLAIALPFLVVCPHDFLEFPLFYFFSSGADVGSTGGLSIWDFLEMGGLRLPGWFFLALTVGALLASYAYAFSRRLTLLEGMLVVLTAFVIVYSRSAAGYFMLPISLLLLWGAEDRWISARCFLLYIPLIASGLFSRSNPHNAPYVEVPEGWIIGVALQLLVIYLILDATRAALRRRNFVDRALDGGGRD